MPKSTLVPVLVLAALPFAAGHHLPSSQLKILQDPGGWEYTLISDKDAGIQTQHTCFDGHPHPDECSGSLTLTPEGTFVQQTSIHHRSVARSGTYKLEDHQITFFDEFGTPDGPYAFKLDPEKNLLFLDNPPLHMELELHSQYIADRDAKRPPPH
jgi:hypothetical protein